MKKKTIKTKLKKKITKAKLKKKLIKECKVLWSAIVRKQNNGICCFCNKNKAQNAHHWFINKARSKALEFKELNGIPLCYGCHIHVIHKDASVSNSLKILKYVEKEQKRSSNSIIRELYKLAENKGKPYSFEDLKKDHEILLDKYNKEDNLNESK